MLKIQPRLVAVLLAIAGALTTTTALASVNDLTSGLLRAGDAPAGFTMPHHRVYNHYQPMMQVGVFEDGRKLAPACAIPASFRLYGWRQGVVEAFDSRRAIKGLQQLSLCGVRFQTANGARLAYRDTVRAMNVYRIHKQVRMVRMGGIGAESMALVSVAKPFSERLLFRRANAFVEIEYAGPSSFSPSRLRHLGGEVNARLR